MNDQWRNFLKDAGVVMADGHALHFGSPKRETKVTISGSVMADFSHDGLIAVRGKDALAFLQGQLTNDIEKVNHGHSQISGYCNPKGRLLAIFRIFYRNDTYYLQLPNAILETVMQRLQKYILMSQLTLEDAGDSLVRIVCAGPDSETALASIFTELPAAPNEARQTGEITIIRLPCNDLSARFFICGDCLAMEKIWSVLDARSAPVGAIAWSQLDIRAGIPEIYPDTVEEFIPQSVNLELLDGVSFKKGCYTGQEIVARLQHLGKTKRRMYRVSIKTEQAPPPGTPIYLKQGEKQSVGTIVKSVMTGDGTCDTLAVIMIEHHDAGTLCLSANEAAVSLETLPYAISSEAG